MFVYCVKLSYLAIIQILEVRKIEGHAGCNGLMLRLLRVTLKDKMGTYELSGFRTG